MTRIGSQPDHRHLAPARLATGLVAGVALYLIDLWGKGAGKTSHELFAVLITTWVFVPVVLLGAFGAMQRRGLTLWALASTVIVVGLSAYQARVSGDSNLPTPPSFAFSLFLAVGLFIAHGLILGASAAGRWRAPYSLYFDIAWKDAVRLALAAAFVGALWLVLFLGAALFNLIGVEALQDIITKPVFAFPATSTFFALAVHVTDARAGLVRGARTLALTLLSWLLPLMTVLAVGFLAALPFTGLEPLWKTKSAAGILLGAAAALIVLINAAYQEGEQEGFPPLALKLSARIAAFVLTPLLAIAAFGLILRIRQHGFTPDRIEGLAAVLLGAVYAHGYGWAAVRAHPWMKHLEGTNVLAAHVALALLLAIFSPLADPARLSVNDQMHRLRTGKVSVQDFDYNFLRHASGLHGRKALDQLVDHPFGLRAAEMAERARNARKAENPWDHVPATAAEQARAVKVIGAEALPGSFTSQVWSNADDPLRDCTGDRSCTAIIRDFDSQGGAEILIQAPSSNNLYAQSGARWDHIGQVPGICGEKNSNALKAGDFTLEPPVRVWNDLVINGRRVPVVLESRCP